MSDETKTKRLRGLKNLIVDGVVHGSSAVEKVHLATTKRTFDILEAIPGIDLPAKPIHAILDLSAKSVYATIRGVTAIVSGALDVVIDQTKEPAPSASESSSEKETEPAAK